MSRWIDAEWLMNFFVDIPDNFTLTIGNLRATVNDAPSIDIVRCKECVDFVYDEQYKCYGCATDNGLMGEIKSNDFCSRGERKESE